MDSLQFAEFWGWVVNCAVGGVVVWVLASFGFVEGKSSWVAACGFVTGPEGLKVLGPVRTEA